MATADEAALRAFLASRRGTRVLSADTQTAIGDYLVAKRTTLPELNTTRPPEGIAFARWLEEWADLAAAAKVVDVLDARNVVRWIEEEDATAASGQRSGKAFAVADALTKKGYTMDRAAELAIARAIAESDAGDCVAQCRMVDVVWLVYTGQSPGEEERKLFADKRAASNSSENGMDPKIDIRAFKGYYKQVGSTTVPTLESALRDKSGRKWARYYADTITLLNEQYSHASLRWIQVVAFAREVAKGSIEIELLYLSVYFFEIHLGRGMPEVESYKAALRCSTGASLPDSLVSTVPDSSSAVAAAELGRWPGQMQQDAYSRMQLAHHQQLAAQAGYGAPPGYGMTGAPFGSGFQPQPNLLAPPPNPLHVSRHVPPYTPPWAYPDFQAQMAGMQLGQQGAGPSSFAGAGDDAPVIEEVVCEWCGKSHLQANCSLYQQARATAKKAAGEKAAQKKLAADARKQAALAAGKRRGGPPGKLVDYLPRSNLRSCRDRRRRIYPGHHILASERRICTVRHILDRDICLATEKPMIEKPITG